MADLVLQQVKIDGTLALPNSTVSKEYLPGDDISLEWQVWNQDSGAAGTNSTGIYVLNSGNTVETSHFNSLGVLSGYGQDTYEASTITLPSDLEPGFYTVCLAADAGNSVPETVEDNTFWAFQINVVAPDEPDLIIQQLKLDGDLVLPNAVAPTKHQAGDAISLNWQVWNQDGGAADASDTGFYLVSPGWVPSVQVANGVGALDEYAKDTSESDTLALPATLDPGRCTIRLAADAENGVPESVENNNFYAVLVDVVDDTVNTAPVITGKAASSYARGTVLKGTDLISVSDADGESDILHVYVYDAIDAPGAEWRFNETVINPGENAVGSRVLDRAIHPLDLAVGSGVVG